MSGGGIEIGLNAAIVAVVGDQPAILTVGGEADEPEALPFGPFDPIRHRTFEIGLRSWVEAQTALRLGHVEQLYTFGDRGRHARPGDTGAHVVSVGYLALTRIDARDGADATTPSSATLARAGAAFRPWYDHFPWEDWRRGRPAVLDEIVLPGMRDWVGEAPDHADPGRAMGRAERFRLFFGEDGSPWDEEKVLERYELIYEAGLVAEARRDGRGGGAAAEAHAPLGRPMRFDHRRILATAISRLRAKLKYRPVVFELMPEIFTLTELQKTVEAISGRHLHKQNFRRLVETAALVEATGETSLATGGRPASLYRFRREVLRERPAPGLRLGTRA